MDIVYCHLCRGHTDTHTHTHVYDYINLEHLWKGILGTDKNSSVAEN